MSAPSWCDVLTGGENCDVLVDGSVHSGEQCEVRCATAQRAGDMRRARHARRTCTRANNDHSTWKGLHGLRWSRGGVGDGGDGGADAGVEEELEEQPSYTRPLRPRRTDGADGGGGAGAGAVYSSRRRAASDLDEPPSFMRLANARAASCAVS